MSRFYSIEAIEKFIANHCVDCLFQGDSVVGLGDQIWTMDNGRYFIVNEIVLNCWSSGHKVRQVSKLSKKQNRFGETLVKSIVKYYNRTWEKYNYQSAMKQAQESLIRKIERAKQGKVWMNYRYEDFQKYDFENEPETTQYAI